MKKIISLVIILFSGFELFAQAEDRNLAEIKESRRNFEQKLGITDVILISPKSKFPNLEFVRNYGECNKEYKRKNESYKFGGFEVEAVRYLFKGDKLSGVFFRLKNNEDYSKLWNEIEMYYGHPQKQFDLSSVGDPIFDYSNFYVLYSKKLDIYIDRNELEFGFYSPQREDCKTK